MPYIIGLFLILGLVFSGFGGFGLDGIYKSAGNAAANVLGAFKNKVFSLAFPKNQKEILIENILSDYNILEDSFSGAAENILKSDKVNETDKTAVRQALEAFKKSEDKLQNLNQLEKEDRSLLKSAIKKILTLDGNSVGNSSATSPVGQQTTSGQSFNQIESGTGPTNIPPQCRLECSSR